MTTVARCTKVWRTYGSGNLARTAVRDVSLIIEAGDVIAVTGPSGSGKSTLLHLLGGLDQPTQGSVEWDDSSAQASGPAMVFQAPSLIPAFNVVENVELPLLIEGAVRANARQRALSALDRLSLVALASRLPDELSGGQAQRIAVARALAQEPALLLADEPTGQLDHEAAEQVVDVLLGAASATGAALVIATHDEEVAGRARVRYEMSDGWLATSTPIRSGP